MMDNYALGSRWNGRAQAYQDYILPMVSRTFALTIPQLPPSLARVVGNAYLLCRAADTIEDEPGLTVEDKLLYEQGLTEVVTGARPAEPFAAELHPLFSAQTLEAERDLIRQLPLVLAVTDGFTPAQRAAVERCVSIMGRGMHHFQQIANPGGLSTLRDLDRYCYYVAGVVGEMLTELFCDYGPHVAARGDRMRRLAVSFGQGLQMTNILKDQCEDRLRGVCWLPRDVFRRHGVSGEALSAGITGPGYASAQQELIGTAHAHLRNALEYALAIPSSEPGIRRFCLWATSLALLTLGNVNRHPGFTSTSQVKVSRQTLATTIMLTNLSVRSDAMLRRLFNWFARGLPLARLSDDWGHPFKHPALACLSTA